ncbi:MAG TPA: alpha/beta fold hydrolase [Candidatus Binatia bacterium]|jgi:pimeloyl-ACP methyl ester carboxylesterase
MRAARLLAVAVFAVAAALTAFVQLAPETALRTALSLERHRSGLVRKEIDLPGGLHYVYLEGGSGEPLMLLHGFGADKDNFTRIARLLVPNYRVVIPDHIGFGESSHPADADYSPPAQAERLHELAAALGITRVHLGGNSMGGHIAMSYAVAYPNDVASLWLLDPGGIWSAPPSELAQVLQKTGRNPLMASNEDEFAKVYAFAMSDPPWVPRAFLDVMARRRIENFALEQKIFEQIRGDRLEERLRGLATPTLIVWGREDRAINVATAEVLHGMLPHSQVIVLDHIGHLPMLEAPERSAADYLAFRASLAASPAATDPT